LFPALHPPGTPLIRTLQGHSLFVTSVALSPDGRRAVSASWDNKLNLWDLETGRELRTLKGHSDSYSFDSTEVAKPIRIPILPESWSNLEQPVIFHARAPQHCPRGPVIS
jgi:WD40 repeat protein